MLVLRLLLDLKGSIAGLHTRLFIFLSLAFLVLPPSVCVSFSSTLVVMCVLV